MGVGEVRIKGVVSKNDQPVEGAYITLNSGETFIAERRTGPDGVYEFHISPGEWILNCRAAGAVALTRTIKQSTGGELVENFQLSPVGH